MKHILLLALITITIAATAQTLDMRPVKNPKFVPPAKTTLHSIIHQNMSGYWVFGYKRTGLTTVYSGYVKYGPDLNEEYTKFFSDKPFSVGTIYWLKDKMIVSGGKMDTKETGHYLLSTCDKDGNIIREAKLLDNMTLQYRPQYNIPIVTYTADSSRLVYIQLIDGKLNAVYVDGNLDYEKVSLDMPYEDGSYEIVSRKLIGLRYYVTVGILTGKKITGYAVACFDIPAQRATRYHSNFSSESILELEIDETETQVRTLGLFYDKTSITGIQYAAFNKADGKLMHSNTSYFTDEMVMGKVRKPYYTIEHGKALLKSSFFIQEVGSSGRGDVIIAAEFNHLRSGRILYDVAHGYRVEDNLVIRLNERGDIKWITGVPKEQSERRYEGSGPYTGSVAAIPASGICYLFYNDMQANLKKNLDENIEKLNCNDVISKDESSIIVATIDEKGILTRKSISGAIDTKDGLNVLMSDKINNNTLLLCRKYSTSPIEKEYTRVTLPY